jgi:general secretion pathway protein A
MYTAYFGFREKPFSVTPDPRFFYTNPGYQEAYANLIYAIRERRGFVMLTGEVGTGKTTLLRRLMENMESNVRFVFFYNTTLTFEEFLSFTCDELGLHVKEGGRLQKIQALNEYLLTQLAKGGTVVLLIDEAQNLGEEVLENLRLLSNLETSSEKLLQIALVGQPELETKLEQAKLRQLKQRIAIQCRLSRLNDEEVGPFINYRLNAVGYKRQQLFTPDAVQEIAFYSKGFPRLINILCDNALLITYATSQKKVTADIVKEAASDLRLVSPIEIEREIMEDANSRRAVDPSTSEENWEPPSPIKIPSRKRRHSQVRGGVWIAAAILLFGLGGTGLYAWRENTSFLESLKEGLESLQHTLQDTLSGRTSNRRPQESRRESSHKISNDVGSTPLADRPGLIIGRDFPKPERQTDDREGRAIANQMQAVNKNAAPMRGNFDENRSSTSTVSAASESSAWKETPLVVQAGSTIAEIATNAYGSQRTLGLDLIKEFNTHIENLNRVFVGQKLWVPPLIRETLVRQQPDGSYNIILASFRMSQQAEQLAQLARLRGYQVVVTPRRVSDSLLLHRVEIGGLKSLEAVDEAWETALTNQWIASADRTVGGRF